MSAHRAVANRSRREEIAKKRESKRPSRTGIQAGSSGPPTPTQDPQGSAFRKRLLDVLARARTASSLGDALATLITLDGDLSHSEGLRALESHDLVVVRLMRGAGFRLVTDFEAGPASFVSEVGLDEVGRLAVTSPLRRFLDEGARNLGVAFRVAWSAESMLRFKQEIDTVRAAEAAEASECRDYLVRLASHELEQIITTLRTAVLSVPPVQLNRGRSVLSNLRDETNLTGKTLSPHSPQCYFTDLARIPLELWSDDEVVVITSLWITYRSGGAHRIESLNGTHVDLDRVWDNFVMIRGEYEHSFVPIDLPTLTPKRPTVSAMLTAAETLNDVRTTLVARRALAHRIGGRHPGKT